MMTTELGKLFMLWRFRDAPKKYRVLSDHGGDEDWVAVIPAGEWTHYGLDEYGDDGYDIPMLFMQVGPFGCCSIRHYQLGDGRLVAIGAHS